MNVLITGGAGFIGSHLSEQLLDLGCKVVVVDNFELGNRDNVNALLSNHNFKLIEADASDVELLSSVMKANGTEAVYHLAANSDIQKSAKDPCIDFRNTFSTTYSVLESMRRNNVKRMFFASTSAVYGEKLNARLKEDAGNLSPISYYGGAKLASEAFISSYSYMNDLDVVIFRFPNVIGPHLTHGVIFDFMNKLKVNPKKLQILGDGTQCKPYIYVLDLIEAILQVTFSGERGVNIYNIGVDGETTVKEIADMICLKLGLENVEYAFTTGNRGWKGDVPSFQYDLTKIQNLGWHAKHTSNESVRATLDSVIE